MCLHTSRRFITLIQDILIIARGNLIKDIVPLQRAWLEFSDECISYREYSFFLFQIIFDKINITFLDREIVNISKHFL